MTQLNRIALVAVTWLMLACSAFPDTFALSIGISDYPEPRDTTGALMKDSNGMPITSDLKGCSNDARAIRSTLISKFNVPAGNIELLTNSLATESGLLTALRSLASKLNVGDTFLFYFSGHGTQVPTQDLAAEPDGLEETLVFYDCLIPDKGIRVISETLNKRGVHATFVFDCCFSGGMSRSPSRLTKSISYKDARSFVKRGIRPLAAATLQLPQTPVSSTAASNAFLSAGKEDQPTVDLSFKDGAPAHGAFTLLLLASLEASPMSGVEALIDSVRKDLLKYKLDQVPQLEVSTAGRRQDPLVPLPPALTCLRRGKNRWVWSPRA